MSSDDGPSEYHNTKLQNHLQLSPKKPSNHHQQLSIHHESAASSSLASASTQTINCCEITGTIAGGTIKRRKSATLSTASPVAYSIHHSQQTGHDDLHDNGGDDDDPKIIGSNKTNTNAISNYGYSNTGNGAGSIGNSNIGSPSKYMHHSDNVYLHLPGNGGNCMSTGNRLSIHHPTTTDRYDSEITTCCLPPPSPAPNSDRFVLGIPSPSLSSQHHHHQQIYQQTPAAENKFSNIHHRSMSPSSRYKNAMPDRYREISQKCERYLPPPHYLAASMPLVSTGGSINNISLGSNSIVSNTNDSYISGYLSSTVHTPIKRYVPTPSLSTEIYSEPLSSHQQASTTNGYHNVSHLPQISQSQPLNARNAPQSSTLPYRYRMKCCSNLDQSMSTTMQSNSSTSTNNSADHYATPPRGRIINKGTSGSSCPSPSPIPPTTSASASSSTTSSSSLALSFPYSNSTNGTMNARSSSRSMQNEHNLATSPSIEYLGPSGTGNIGGNTCRNALSPNSVDNYSSTTYMNAASNNGMAANNLGNNSGACLHCSTIRRTTGVHQTTQTTGPISPIPQNGLLTAPSGGCPDNNLCIMAADQADINSANNTISYQTALTQHCNQDPDQLTAAQQYSMTANIRQQQLNMIHQAHNQISNAYTMSNRSAARTQSNQVQLQNAMHGQQVAPYIAPQQNPPIQVQSMPLQENMPNVQQQPSTENSDGQLVIFSRKQKIKKYVKREVSKFFGVDMTSEERERIKWSDRQRRLALRRFGTLKADAEIITQNQINERRQCEHGDRPDILPADNLSHAVIPHHHQNYHHHHHMNRRVGDNRRHPMDDMCNDLDLDDDDDDDPDIDRSNDVNTNQAGTHLIIERKASVPVMIWAGINYAIQALSKKIPRTQTQWSRSFAPQYVRNPNRFVSQQLDEGLSTNNGGANNGNETYDTVTTLPDNEVFFDSPNTNNVVATANNSASNRVQSNDQSRQLYFGDRSLNGWCTRSNTNGDEAHNSHQLQSRFVNNSNVVRGTRISSQILDGVLDNSRRPKQSKLKLLPVDKLDDRYDHRPYFTYWINTVQIIVLCLSIVCYGFGPIGIGMEQKNGQVLVTTLSLQQVQYQEARNVWLGPRGDDLVHLGAKFAACMRRDLKVIDVMAKTRRQERETACCIRNDDSGCVQSSQADCSIRGLWPTSISTWKKWSHGESGPGGRISGSVCGLDPKYCDAPASIAPHEWPDDITKWPICRKTNSNSQRFRFKDNPAEHMVCEVIGHPCCIGVYGECRITTREFCDFVNGYFHEEASLCSQVSCLNDICGMFPFLSADIPDQFYRLFTSLCLHAGIIHLAITIAFQHIYLADLERLLGPIRTAILYIGCGVAGNMTSAIFLPYKPEVGPLASLAGVVSSMTVLLIFIHWKQLKRPYMALMKLIFLAICIFGMGTLPWQQHFIGIVGGIMGGAVLTITLVPFLSVSKYGRKSKIKLIWTCFLCHLAIYTSMFIMFYQFPMALSTIGSWCGTDSNNMNNLYNGAIGSGYSVGGNIVACDNNKGMQCGGTSGSNSGGIVRSAINV